MRRPAARDEQARVGEREHTSEVCSCEFADRVTDDEVGHHTQALQGPRERDLDGEQCRLCVLGPRERCFGVYALGEHHVAQRPRQQRFEAREHAIEVCGENIEVSRERATHAGVLGALAREHEGELGRAGLDHVGLVRVELGERRDDRRGAVAKYSPPSRQAMGDVDQVVFFVSEAARGGDHRSNRRFVLAAEHERPARGRGLVDPGLGGGLGRGLGDLERRVLEHDVGVGAREPKRRHGSTARRRTSGPRLRIAKQPQTTRRPVDLRGGLLAVGASVAVARAAWRGPS